MQLHDSPQSLFVTSDAARYDGPVSVRYAIDGNRLLWSATAWLEGAPLASGVTIAGPSGGKASAEQAIGEALDRALPMARGDGDGAKRSFLPVWDRNGDVRVIPRPATDLQAGDLVLVAERLDGGASGRHRLDLVAKVSGGGTRLVTCRTLGDASASVTFDRAAVLAVDDGSLHYTDERLFADFHVAPRTEGSIHSLWVDIVHGARSLRAVDLEVQRLATIGGLVAIDELTFWHPTFVALAGRGHLAWGPDNVDRHDLVRLDENDPLSIRGLRPTTLVTSDGREHFYGEILQVTRDGEVLNRPAAQAQGFDLLASEGPAAYVGQVQTQLAALAL